MTKSQLSLYAVLICGSICVLWTTSESKEEKAIKFAIHKIESQFEAKKAELAHEQARLQAVDSTILVHEDLARLAEVKAK